MDNKNIALEIANAIVKDLWLKGLITDKEKENAIIRCPNCGAKIKTGNKKCEFPMQLLKKYCNI